MVNLFNAAAEIEEFLNHQKMPFCFIGGIANLRWGEIRTTNDLDLTILCGFGNEEKIISPLIDHFRSRISNPLQFAIDERVLLLYSSEGIPIDVSLSGLDFEEKMIENASMYEISEGINVRTVSAEDLIITKAFANRPKDIQDVIGIVKRQGKLLDINYILLNIEPLAQLKNDASIVQNLKKLFDGV
jgi:hypothetical protein